MAIVLHPIENENKTFIECIISGCHHSKGCSTSAQCGKLFYCEEFHPSRATPISRLFRSVYCDKSNMIDSIVSKFKNHFSDETHIEDNGIEYMKSLILDTLIREDLSWNLCKGCHKEYGIGERDFADIMFLPKEKFHCSEHTL